MGEMADFLNEQIEEMEYDRFLYRTGVISDNEAFDQGIIDERGYEFSPSPRRILQCKFCGKTPLHWKHVSGRWLMFEKSEEIHLCPKNPLTVESLKQLLRDKKNE